MTYRLSEAAGTPRYPLSGARVRSAVSPSAVQFTRIGFSHRSSTPWRLSSRLC